MAKKAKVTRIDCFDGMVDDVAIEDVTMARIEMMSGTSCWIKLYTKRGSFTFWANSKSKLKVTQGEHDPKEIG